MDIFEAGIEIGTAQCLTATEQDFELIVNLVAGFNFFIIFASLAIGFFVSRFLHTTFERERDDWIEQELSDLDLKIRSKN